MNICFTIAFLCFTAGLKTCESCSHDIPHGHVKWWCSPDYAVCTYSCDEGYEENQDISWITCTSSGQWVSVRSLSGTSKDLCMPKPCPNKIPNGRLSDTCESKVGSTCEYSCDNGYQKKADVASITCQTSTNWSVNPHSLCTNNQQCGYEVVNGDLDFSCRRNHGDTCSFSCREGYLPSAVPMSGTIMCDSALIWSQPLSSLCKDIQCPSTIHNGVVSSECSRAYKVICDYDCNEDYVKPPVSLSLKCNTSGEWQWREHAGEPCAKKDELCPSKIKNGEIVWHCHRQPGARCTYSCDSSCSQDRSRVWLTCGNDGKWNTNTNTLCTNCSTTTTARPSQCPYIIPNGSMSQTCSRIPYSMCSYTCSKGCWEAYSKLSCLGSGHWNNEDSACRCQDSTTTSARPNQCPVIIPNGSMYLCSRSLYTVCSYTCTRGCTKAYRTLRCSGSGYWYYEGSACRCKDSMTTTARPKQCPVIIPNGSMYLSCSRSLYTVCSYTCTRGCTKAFNTLRCSGSGHWYYKESACRCQDSTTTTARPNQCPVIIPNGSMHLSCSRSLYTVCSYTCTRGCSKAYNTLRCSGSGHWYYEGSACRCQGHSVTSSTTTTATFPRRCPSTVPNGFISVVCERSPYRQCDYACDSGCYKVYGSLYCSSERQWQYGDSACKCGDYTQPPLPEPGFSSRSSLAAPVAGITLTVIAALTAIFVFVAIKYKRYKRQHIRNQPVRYQVPATQRNLTAFSPGSTRIPAPLYTLPDQENIYTSLQQNNNVELYSQPQSIINGPPDYDSIPKLGEDPPSYEQVILSPSEFKV